MSSGADASCGRILAECLGSWEKPDVCVASTETVQRLKFQGWNCTVELAQWHMSPVNQFLADFATQNTHISINRNKCILTLSHLQID